MIRLIFLEAFTSRKQTFIEQETLSIKMKSKFESCGFDPDGKRGEVWEHRLRTKAIVTKQALPELRDYLDKFSQEKICYSLQKRVC